MISDCLGVYEEDEIMADDDFQSTDITVLEQSVTMNICEKEVELDGVTFREIRKKNEGGHQTSIISNNYFIDAPLDKVPALNQKQIDLREKIEVAQKLEDD